MLPSSTAEHLHVLFGLLLHGRFASSPHLFIYSMGHNPIYFIFLQKLSQLWLLAVLSVDSCAPLTSTHQWVCILVSFFFFPPALPQFGALQNTPSSSPITSYPDPFFQFYFYFYYQF